MSEEVIELSIQETNELRRKLGLKPLRIDNNRDTEALNGDKNGEKTDSFGKNKSTDTGDTNSTGKNGEETKNDGDSPQLGRSQRTAYHKPAENTGEMVLAKRRIEEAKVKREVQQGLQNLERQVKDDKISENDDKSRSTLDWASRMRSAPSGSKGEGKTKREKKKKHSKKTKKETELNSTAAGSEKLDAQPTLEQMKVGHSLNVGDHDDDQNSSSEIILTLRDESILKMDEHGRKVKGVRGEDGDEDDDENVLENVSAAEAQRAKENLRKKRQLAFGRGHAGGYAGWDDDEFDELGGIGDAGGGGYGQAPKSSSGVEGDKKKLYTLGDLMERQKEAQAMGGSGSSNHLFASKQSAFSSVGGDMDTDAFGRVASDVMTSEELEEEVAATTMMAGKTIDHAAREAKRKRKQEKKEKKMFKKLKKKEKQEKKQKRKVEVEESGDEKEGEEDTEATLLKGNNLKANNARMNEAEGKEEGLRTGVKRPIQDTDDIAAENEIEREQRVAAIRRQKFDAVMEKGNARTRAAFKTEKRPGNNQDDEFGSDFNGGDDSAILNTALAKARRLQRLKELQKRNSDSGAGDKTASTGSMSRARDEDAAAQSVLSSLKEIESTDKNFSNQRNGADSVKFEFDETKEFSRALLARSEMANRSEARRGKPSTLSRGGVEFTSSGRATKDEDKEEGRDLQDTSVKSNSQDIDTDENELAMKELSKDVHVNEASDHEDEVGATFGAAAPLGRGLAGALSMLKSTGDITGKYAGKEEMRGRAKDERTYEDYDHLDLKKVVKIDLATATEKDREFANREINLDYRDSEGRLLTRKEAWRQLCYQFHGHGSSYKNEERRTKQMQRENELRAKQAEAAERGMFGALKATQKATGKAFVVHKTS